MNKIKSAKWIVEFSWCEAGEKFLPNEGLWEHRHMNYEDSDLRTLAAHGIVEIEEEQDQPRPDPIDRLQPCGCVLCVCEDEDRCHGCGAHLCDEHRRTNTAPCAKPAATVEIDEQEHPVQYAMGDLRKAMRNLEAALSKKLVRGDYNASL